MRFILPVKNENLHRHIHTLAWIEYYIKVSIISNVKISLIIPIFNSSQHLEECLDSILKQQKISIELICINDGSIDDSLNILERYKFYDERVVIVSKINEGPAVARNVGVDLSKGEYLMFVDSDDIIRDDSLEYIYTLISENNLELCYLEHKKFVDLDDLLFSRNKNYSLKVVSGINYIESNISSGFNCDKVWKRDFYLQKNIKAEHGFYFEDQIPTLKGFIEADRCGISNYDFYGYRDNINSTTNSQINEKHIQSLIYILDEYISICLRKNVYFHLHPMAKITIMYRIITRYKYLIKDYEDKKVIGRLDIKIKFIKSKYDRGGINFYLKYGVTATALFYLPVNILNFIVYLKRRGK